MSSGKTNPDLIFFSPPSVSIYSPFLDHSHSSLGSPQKHCEVQNSAIVQRHSPLPLTSIPRQAPSSGSGVFPIPMSLSPSSPAEQMFCESLQNYEAGVEPVDDQFGESTASCSRTVAPTSYTLPPRVVGESPNTSKQTASTLNPMTNPASSRTATPPPPIHTANSKGSNNVINNSFLSPLQSLPSSAKRVRHATFIPLDSAHENDNGAAVPEYPSSQPCTPGHSITEEERQYLMRQQEFVGTDPAATLHSMNAMFTGHRSLGRYGGQNDMTCTNVNNATFTLPNSNSRASYGAGKKNRKKIRKLAVKIHAYATPAHAYYPLHAEEESNYLSNFSIPGLGSTRLLSAAAAATAAVRRREERKRAIVISPSEEGGNKEVRQNEEVGNELARLKSTEVGRSNHSVALDDNMNSESNMLKNKSRQEKHHISSGNEKEGVGTSLIQPNRRSSLQLHLSTSANNRNASFGGHTEGGNSSFSLGRWRNTNTGLLGEGGISPRGKFREAPPNLEGRRWEARRFSLPTCPPYRIPLYDQAVFKYVFDSLYVDHITLMQYFFLIQSVAMFVLNLIMTVVNVVSAVTFTQEISPWITTAATVCFILEFAVTALCLVFLIVVMLEAVIFNNIGTSLAHDISFLITLGGSFSVLRFAGLATPLFAMRRILPIFQRASSAVDYGIGIISIILWVLACFISFLVLISKASQIYFALVLPIASWTIMDYIRLVGLCVNLSRVDDSYFKEMSVLLDAAHRHYAFPGEAEEAHPYEKLCLLSRIRVFFHIPMYMYFTLFDTVYNFHWRSKYEREELIAQLKREEMERQAQRRKDRKKKNENAAARQVVDGTVEPNSESPPSHLGNRRQRVVAAAEADVSQQEKEVQNTSRDRHYRQTRLSRGRRMWLMFNYLAFIFEVDPVQLRRYLQMVQSPLPFYQLGRDAFMKAFMDNDLVGMNMAVRNSEPQNNTTAHYAKEDPQQFSPAFTCDDGRTLWDSNACVEQWNRKDLERTKEMVRCLQFAEKFKY